MSLLWELMRADEMAAPRFFHEISGNLRELPEQGPFRSERELQEFFEKHLHTLTRVEFLESEHSTGQRHRRRIDTLGIDDAGRPVVVEYKRRQDQNVINQGLDYLEWLDDHRAEFRELVSKRLGDGRVAGIDFTAARLLCIAAGFPRQDKIAAANSRRRIDLLVYRRFGDAFVALEWAHGGEPPAPDAGGDAPDFPQNREVTIRDRPHPKGGAATAGGLRQSQRARSISRRVTEDEFLESCNEFGKEVFASMLDLARRESMPIHWGSTRFSVGVAVHGTRAVVCYANPPNSHYKQSLYTALRDRAGIQRKLGASDEVIDRLWQSAEATGLFTPAGRELKCVIDRKFAIHEVDALVAWCESVGQEIAGQGQANDPHTGR